MKPDFTIDSDGTPMGTIIRDAEGRHVVNVTALAITLDVDRGKGLPTATFECINVGAKFRLRADQVAVRPRFDLRNEINRGIAWLILGIALGATSAFVMLIR